MMGRKEYTSISIPKKLHEKIKDMIEDTSFVSVSEFTKNVLRDIVSDGEITESQLSREEVEKVRKRLRKLGYLE